MKMNSLQIKQVRLDDLMPLIREQLNQGKTVCFSPMGTSMLPMLRQGIDTVTLSSPPERLRKYDLPLYQRDDGKYILHRVVGVGETYTCLGDNQFTLEYGVRQDQIIALVTSFSRSGREISVTHPGYRLYCCLWFYSRPVRRFFRRVRNFIGRWLRRIR